MCSFVVHFLLKRKRTKRNFGPRGRTLPAGPGSAGNGKNSQAPPAQTDCRSRRTCEKRFPALLREAGGNFRVPEVSRADDDARAEDSTSLPGESEMILRTQSVESDQKTRAEVFTSLPGRERNDFAYPKCRERMMMPRRKIPRPCRGEDEILSRARSAESG